MNKIKVVIDGFICGFWYGRDMDIGKFYSNFLGVDCYVWLIVSEENEWRELFSFFIYCRKFLFEF